MRLLVGNVLTEVVAGGKDNLSGYNVEKEVKKYLKYRVDGYRFSLAYKKKRWDGYKSMMKYKKFPTGFMPYVVKYMKDLGIEVIIEDERGPVPTFVDVWNTQIGSFELRSDQLALAQRCNVTVEGIPFPRGLVDAATNAGKSIIMAGMLYNMEGWDNCILLVNSKKIYEKSVKDFAEFFQVGQINDKHYDIQTFTVAMAQSLGNRMKKSVNVCNDMNKFQVLFYDEVHHSGSNENSFVVSNIPAGARYGFSGTSLDVKNTEKKLKIIGHYAPSVGVITNQEMIDKGVSLRPIVHIWKNWDWSVGDNVDYEAELNRGLHFSGLRRKLVKQILEIEAGKQILIAYRIIEHGEFMAFKLKQWFPDMAIEVTHGKDPESSEKIQRFENKETQVLISSMILKEGLNINCIEVLVMAMGGKDKITVKQLVGRALRLNGSAETVNIYDFMDYGHYLTKHSRARIQVYKAEGFEIKYNYEGNRWGTPLNE